MLIPSAADANHKAWMYRLLTVVADDMLLSSNLFFKGGTCAAMRGFLDRFSVDLDFDLAHESQMGKIKSHLEKSFDRLGLVIHDQSKNYLQYFLKYESPPHTRNTLKIDINFPIPKNNEYEPVRFNELDRIIRCQTLETMFANKLIAVMGRFQKNGSVAGRDIFDIHSFLIKGYSFKSEIIEELSGKSVQKYIQELKVFIEKHFSQTDIDEDLNHLLPAVQFRRMRKVLKQEVLAFLPY